MIEIVQKIPPHYIKGDCVQVMLGYKSTFTLFDKSGILFNKSPNNQDVNRYLTDKRRFFFPYSDIPSHVRRYQIFERINVTNQILNFGENYFAISDGHLIQQYVAPDKEGALLITRMYPKMVDEKDSTEIASVAVSYMERKSLDELFTLDESSDGMFTLKSPNRKSYVVAGTGEVHINDGSLQYLSEDEIVKRLKEKYLNQLTECKKFALLDDDAIKSIEHLVANMTIDSVHNYVLDPISYVIEFDGETISADRVCTTLIKKDSYKVVKRGVPTIEYTEEQLEALSSKATKIREPKISSHLNPSVLRDTINGARRLVRTRRKKAQQLDNK